MYRATEFPLGRTVALKVIRPDPTLDHEALARLQDEALAVAAIDHQNVVPVYDAGEADGAVFIAMRWIDGADLQRRLSAGGPLGLERAAAIVGGVAAALDAVHARGFVHLDVKPGNVLLTAGELPFTGYLAMSVLLLGAMSLMAGVWLRGRTRAA